jgi:hypothetical protein
MERVHDMGGRARFFGPLPSIDLAGHRRVHPAAAGSPPRRRSAPALGATVTSRAADPLRVRRGFRYLRRKTIQPAGAPKPSHPGPGRPPGSRNRHRATRYDVGKTVTRDTAKTITQQVRGERQAETEGGLGDVPCSRGRSLPACEGLDLHPGADPGAGLRCIRRRTPPGQDQMSRSSTSGRLPSPVRVS